MSGRVFLDTNVFVYLFDQAETEKRHQCEEHVARLLDADLAVVSYQVIQEFVSVALRRFQRTLPAPELQTYLDRVLWPICQVFPTSALYSEAMLIAQETGWTFYDSLVVSAAEKTGCSVLLTEDLQAGRTIRGVEIRNPFA